MGNPSVSYFATDIGLAAGWYAVLIVAGIVVWPLSYWIFRRWPDRGVLLARPLGILLLGHITWFLSGITGFPFSRIGLLLVAIALAGMSMWFARKRWPRLKREIVSAKRFLIWAEVLALAAFLLMVQVRRYEPDIQGTEKYMDLGIYSSLLRETQVPPRDMWMAGGAINYHYGGYMLLSIPGKLLGYSPGYAYNLALATVFCFAMMVSLVLGAHLGRGRIRWGVLSALLTCCIGNLVGVRNMLVKGQWGYVGSLFDLRWSYCWNASRVIHDGGPPFDGNTETINEFPLFSFVWADLHPHVNAFAWGVLFLALTLALWQSPYWKRPRMALRTFRRLLWPLCLPIAVGAAMLPINNLFDLPTYGLVYSMVLLLGVYTWVKRFERDGTQASRVVTVLICLGLAVVSIELPTLFYGPDQTPNAVRACGLVVALLALGIAVWNYRSIVGGERWRSLIPLGVMGGVMAAGFVLGLPFWLHYQAPARETGLIARAAFSSGFGEYFLVFGFHLTAILCGGWLILNEQFKQGLSKEIILFLAFLAGGISVVLWVMTDTLTVPLVWVLIFQTASIFVLESTGNRPDSRFQFGLVLILTALALMLGCEFFYLVDNYGSKRMNTLFKFHYQAWILLGIGLPVLVRMGCERCNGEIRRLWLLTPAVILLAGTFIFPYSYLITLFDPRSLDAWGGRRAPNLDGQYYMQREHPADWYVIDTVLREIPGRPVVLEAWGGAYRYESVLSSNIGVITVLGWENHENVWRGGAMRSEIMQRQRAIDEIYRSPDLEPLRRYAKQYGIEYVFVGSVEREKYPGALEKFEQLEQIVRSPETVLQASSRLYKVPSEWLTS